MSKRRVFSGIQPTGEIHLGNYLGAIRGWAKQLDERDAIHCVVDLHAVTVPRDADELRTRTREVVLLLVAAGLDPDRCILFAQSQVHEHAELSWIMECTASFGELSRMTQFKEKSAQQREFVSGGLFTYPALQAADVLLYDTDEVPVGDDQRQHIELARDLAIRFNSRYGEVLKVPEHVIPPIGARIMDLQNPTAKMSKSADSPQGTVLLFDDPKDVERKIKRAVTDSGGDVSWDPQGKPGVSNLLSILAAATDESPEALAGRYEQYGSLKTATAEAVVEALRPIRERHAELSKDPTTADEILATGAAKARAIAAKTMARVREALGLPPV